MPYRPYARLPTAEGGDDRPTLRERWHRWQRHRPPLPRVLLGLAAAFVLAHYIYLLLLAPSPPSQPTPSMDWIRPAAPPPLPLPPPIAGAAGTPYRDATPIATAQRFLALAEAEIAARGLDTCGGELGSAMVRAAARRRMVYCAAPGLSNSSDLGGVEAGDPDAGARLAAAESAAPRIECMPLRDVGRPGIEGADESLHAVPGWWPLTSAACVSRHLRPVARVNQRNFVASGCAVTAEGEKLRRVAGEAFVGKSVVEPEKGETCRRVLGHTVMFVQRMDQWNPFHVAEDLVMALLSLLVAGEAVPELAEHRIQLAFLDYFALDGNRFEGVWERVGALPPRRAQHEPFDDGVCLSAAIHGIYGRTSLLSASGLRGDYVCAAGITWAAAHYYRHLFGLAPPPPPLNTTSPPHHINVLYVSRARLRHHLGGGVSAWQEYRELENEGEMVARWRAGLREWCEAQGCDFVDANAYPEVWGDMGVGGDGGAGGPKGKGGGEGREGGREGGEGGRKREGEGSRWQLRFAAIDPTAHALETQVHLAGHASLLVGQHGGALGLTLFLPPGRGAVLEFVVPMVARNHHFQHMAAQMGHAYRSRGIRARVDVEQAWVDLREAVEAVGEGMGERGA